MSRKDEGQKKLNARKKAAQAAKQLKGKSIEKMNPKEIAGLLQIICQLLGLADENGVLE